MRYVISVSCIVAPPACILFIIYKSFQLKILHKKRICKYMKKLNYFSFIQALLCTLVSTKRVCNYVKFLYFRRFEDFNSDVL